MKKSISLILTITILVIMAVPAYADSSEGKSLSGNNEFIKTVEAIDIDNDVYNFIRTQTDTYSQVITYKGDQIIANAIYYFGASYITEYVSGEKIDIKDYGLLGTDYQIINDTKFSTNAKAVKYSLDYSKNKGFELHGFIAAVEATLFAALFPGMGVGIAVGIVSAAISYGLSYIYYNIKQYSGKDSKYYYIKRVVKCYTTSSHSKQIGKTWTGVQKKGIAYA